MPNRNQVLKKFYAETIAKLEKEKAKYKHFKEVIEAFEIIQDHSKKQLEQLEQEREEK